MCGPHQSEHKSKQYLSVKLPFNEIFWSNEDIGALSLPFLWCFSHWLRGVGYSLTLSLTRSRLFIAALNYPTLNYTHNPTARPACGVIHASVHLCCSIYSSQCLLCSYISIESFWKATKNKIATFWNSAFKEYFATSILLVLVSTPLLWDGFKLQAEKKWTGCLWLWATPVFLLSVRCKILAGFVWLYLCVPVRCKKWAGVCVSDARSTDFPQTAKVSTRTNQHGAPIPRRRNLKGKLSFLKVLKWTLI